MSRKTLQLDDALHEYILANGVREPEVFADLRKETESMEKAQMQISPEQGQFMSFLVGAIQAKKAIEIGTFTGYSALWIARALTSDGKLYACDKSEEWTEVAKRYWERAGLSDKIQLHLGLAKNTLDDLISEGHRQTFNFAFIDADKTNYETYYEQCLQLLGPRGVVAVDNTLWSGAVADPDNTEPSTEAIRRLAEKMHDDERIELSLLPIGDGLTLGMKR